MRFLKFIPWSELENWSAANSQTRKFSDKFQIVNLGFILKDLTRERIFNLKDDYFYKEPTISSKTNTISTRKQGFGRDFKVKRRIQICKGDLVISKMHTQNGLYAVSDDEFASTSTFVPFSIDNLKVCKDFLFIALKFVLSDLQKFDSVNRETYKIDEILNLNFPLPPLEIQEKIVAEYKEKIAQIDKLNLEISNLKDESKDYFLSALGLEKREQFEEKTSKTLLNLKWWSEIENWSAIDESNEKYSAKYPFVKLGDICETNIGLTYSPNDVSYDEEAIPVLRSNNIKENKISYEDLVKVSIKPRKSQMASSGDLLICVRNGSKNLVGKVALIEKDRMSFGAFMAIIRSEYNKFLYYFLMSDYFRNNASFAKSTGINQISQNDLKNFQIPLPPIETQKEICSRLDEAQNQIELRKAQIATLMAAAKEDFEKAIFQI